MRLRGVRPQRSGVLFAGRLIDGYRALLWTRLASRVLLTLAEVDATSADALYEGIKALPWEAHVRPDGTIAVDAAGTNAELRNTQFTAVRAKDAIADRLRESSGERPSVDTVSTRPARERGDPPRARDGLARPRGAAAAPSRLPGPRRAGRGADEGDARRRGPRVRGLGRDLRRGRCVRRSDVRVGHARDRGRTGGRRRGPGASATGPPGDKVAGARRERLVAATRRGRATPRRGPRADTADRRLGLGRPSSRGGCRVRGASRTRGRRRRLSTRPHPGGAAHGRR